MIPTKRRTLAVLTVAGLLGGCLDDGTADPASTSPADPAAYFAPAPPSFPGADAFVSGIDNPYLGFATGRTFTYEGQTDEGIETVVVEVTGETKTILGVETTVIHDQAFLDGELIEDTFDWFAQDADGNVWYFGEDSSRIEDGEVVSKEGSWEAGVDGAEPGIIMLAEPVVGMMYRQEFAEGVAEDMAQVKSLTAVVETALGGFEDCLETRDWNALEPGANERKFYAWGVGLVLEHSKKGNGNLETLELVSIEDP